MAKVVIALKIMPEDTAVDLKAVENSANEKIKQFGGDVGKVEIELIAFGLKALKITFVIDEAKSSTEPLESEISKIKGVNSVQVVDFRRAVG